MPLPRFLALAVPSRMGWDQLFNIINSFFRLICPTRLKKLDQNIISLEKHDDSICHLKMIPNLQIS